jgi:Cof subfamily protein (haloacid dehalogenase superfamily)
VAATGRSRYSAEPKLAGIDSIRWLVCSNGAMVWDRQAGVLDTHRPIEASAAQACLSALRANVAGVAIGWETPDGFGFDNESHYRPPGIDDYQLRYDLPEPDGSFDVTKLIVTAHGIQGADMLDSHIGVHLPQEVEGAASADSFIEVTGANVHKASTLAVLTARLGIDAKDVAAFGDQHNDLDMLRWAGTGYAMGNAQPKVLAVADTVLPTNAEDGVATAIESWLGQ